MEPQRMRMPHPNQLPDSPGSQSRWRSDRSTQDRLNSSTPMAVQIRSNQPLNVPPPLPPPRYVNDAYPEPHRLRGGRLSGGSIDEGYANSGGSTSFPKHWAKAMNEKRIPEHLEHPRRETAFVPSSLNRSPTDSDRRYETMRLQDEGYFSLSGPSPAVQQLPGEKQLHHRDQEKSSQAYDQNILSKIGSKVGKPSTSPTRTGSVDSSPTSILFSQRHPSQLRSLSFPNTKASTLSDPPIKQEPSGRFADSPHSRPVSPRSFSSKPYTDFRSPTFDQSSRSSTIDSENGPPPPFHRFPSSIDISRQQKARRSGSSGSLLASVDESSYIAPNPVKRENYERPIFSAADPDSAYRVEDDVRQLQLEDRTPLSGHPDTSHFRFSDAFDPSRCSMSRPAGTKRKLSHEGASKAVSAAALTEQAARAQEYINAPRHMPAQHPNHYSHHQGSVSSQASSAYRHDSYASSADAPIGDGAYTGLGRSSPGGVSPTSENQHYSQFNPMPMTLASNTSAGPYPQPQPPDAYAPPSKSSSSSRKQSHNSTQPPYACTCCQKKPKKFQTLEELNQHTNEKQYSCHYCQNKFKNKNEAERHQNSIHRKMNSWSCAELEKPEEAFFPAASFLPTTTGGGFPPPPPLANGVPQTDLCGYCGDEFPNDPLDWEARQQHLLSIHKFGECNRAKKFFRADHFRQHLKHSHGGKTGKHTNALEQRCARDESTSMDESSHPGTPTQIHGAPIANMQNIRPYPGITPSGPNPQDPSQQQAQGQMSPQQGNMGPPPLQVVPMDMNIDPTMNYLAQHQPSQQQAMHIPGSANGEGYDYRAEGSA